MVGGARGRVCNLKCRFICKQSCNWKMYTHYINFDAFSYDAVKIAWRFDAHLRFPAKMCRWPWRSTRYARSNKKWRLLCVIAKKTPECSLQTPPAGRGLEIIFAVLRGAKVKLRISRSAGGKVLVKLIFFDFCSLSVDSLSYSTLCCTANRILIWI